jgi:hypothetical protein
MTEDFQQQLMEALISSPGEGGRPKVEDLLLEFADVDPKVRLITRYLAQRRAEEGESELPPDDGTGEAPPEGNGRAERVEWQEDKTPRSLRRLERMVQDMHIELEELREKNDALAAALGACYLCWGKDLGCEVCHGRGRPGSAVPDRALFAQFVAPAVRRFRAEKGIEPIRFR